MYIVYVTGGMLLLIFLPRQKKNVGNGSEVYINGRSVKSLIECFNIFTVFLPKKGGGFVTLSLGFSTVSTLVSMHIGKNIWWCVLFITENRCQLHLWVFSIRVSECDLFLHSDLFKGQVNIMWGIFLHTYTEAFS